MATHDYIINNQSAPDFRADLNNALLAIVSQNSGSSAPGTTYANMLWYDTGTNQIKKRNEANSAWVVLGTVDEAGGTFTPTGLPVIATQVEAQAGTDNTKMMTPLRAAQAIATLGGLGGVNIQAFTSSGTYAPTAGYKYAFVIATGGGQGGYGQTSSSGGKSADTVMSVISLSGLASQTVSIGAGGTGGLNSTSGGTGGNSSVGSLVLAKGGNSSTSNIGTFSSPGTIVTNTSPGGGSFWGLGGYSSTSGGNATCYGAGGGAATAFGNYAGTGGTGVVFILEFK